MACKNVLPVSSNNSKEMSLVLVLYPNNRYITICKCGEKDKALEFVARVIILYLSLTRKICNRLLLLIHLIVQTRANFSFLVFSLDISP